MEQRRILGAIAIIFDMNHRILLTKRHDLSHPEMHGKWQLPGGEVEWGEDPKDAVLREVKEEVGIKVKLLSKTPFVFSHIYKERQVNVVLLGFPTRYTTGTVDTSQDEETGEAKWFRYEEIDFAQSLPLTKALVDEALKFI